MSLVANKSSAVFFLVSRARLFLSAGGARGKRVRVCVRRVCVCRVCVRVRGAFFACVRGAVVRCNVRFGRGGTVFAGSNGAICVF